MKGTFFGISLAVLGLTQSFVYAQEARHPGPAAPALGTDIVHFESPFAGWVMD